MSAPIAHLFLAVQILSGSLKDKFNEKEFIIGTSFPDIRYLKIIDRQQTHLKNVAIEDVKTEKDSFKAGILFHCLVDIEREKYMNENKIYEKIPKFKYSSQALKFAEDEILFEFFSPQKYVNYFDEVLDKENIFDVKKENVLKWHSLLKNYFISTDPITNIMMNYFETIWPKSYSITKFIFSIYFINGFKMIVKKISSDKEIRKIILNFYLNFPKKF